MRGVVLLQAPGVRDAAVPDEAPLAAGRPVRVLLLDPTKRRADQALELVVVGQAEQDAALSCITPDGAEDLRHVPADGRVSLGPKLHHGPLVASRHAVQGHVPEVREEVGIHTLVEAGVEGALKGTPMPLVPLLTDCLGRLQPARARLQDLLPCLHQGLHVFHLELSALRQPVQVAARCMPRIWRGPSPTSPPRVGPPRGLSQGGSTIAATSADISQV